VHHDLLDVLAAFAEHDVEYVLLGGYAMAVHGLVRATGDLDLLVRTGEANAERVMAALEAYGRPPHVHKEHFIVAGTNPPTGVWFGREPLRVDLLTSVQGLTWDEAQHEVLLADIDGVPVRVISARAFLRSKVAAGRTKDLADIEHLRRQLEDR